VVEELAEALPWRVRADHQADEQAGELDHPREVRARIEPACDGANSGMRNTVTGIAASVWPSGRASRSARAGAVVHDDRMAEPVRSDRTRRTHERVPRSTGLRRQQESNRLAGKLRR
jgi:2-polyprenyl-6-methoxyphenol hydroxylase-like FAD-dependent oxidoreductase